MTGECAREFRLTARHETRDMARRTAHTIRDDGFATMGAALPWEPLLSERKVRLPQECDGACTAEQVKNWRLRR
jgi:hypothetical protein